MNTLEVFGIIFIVVQIAEAVIIYKYRYQVRRLILDVIRSQQIILPQADYRSRTIEPDELFRQYVTLNDDTPHKSIVHTTVPHRDSRGRFAKATA
jgi:hypothetical protein